MTISIRDSILAIKATDPQRDSKLGVLLHRATVAKWMSRKTCRRIDEAVIKVRKAWAIK